MKIVSKKLYPYAKRALDIVIKEHGDSMTIMVGGALLSLGTDGDGEIAVFDVMRNYFDIDAVERALSVFIGQRKDSEYSYPPIAIVEKKDSAWRQEKEKFIKSLQDMLTV